MSVCIDRYFNLFVTAITEDSSLIIFLSKCIESKGPTGSQVNEGTVLIHPQEGCPTEFVQTGT